jgi:protein involved in polysaccharide export with SLBB domain
MFKKWRSQVQIVPGRRMTLLLGWLALVMLGGTGQAQEYRLGPEDVLSVTVLRHPEWSVDLMTVTSAGKISLPVVGDLFVSGKTTSQVDAEITRRLRGRVLRPEVTVTLKQARLARIFVLGVVAKPGAYDIKPGWRVSEALAVAGGPTVRTEVIEATLSRANQKAMPINLAKILIDSSSAANLTLRPGDTLRFSSRTIQVFVSGQVQKPGGYEVTQGDSMPELLTQAGGATAVAALKRISVQRAGKTYPVDAYAALKEGKAVGFPLQDGDFVVVPENTMKVLVMPAVNRPGYVAMPEDGKMTVADALSAAGGPKDRARLFEVALLRQTPSGGVQKQIINLDRLKKEGGSMASTLNQPLQPGDVVFVPEGKTSQGFLKGVTQFLPFVRMFGF